MKNLFTLGLVVTMSSLTIFVLFMIFNAPQESTKLTYAPKYSDLVTREVVVGISKSWKPIQDRTCFDITDNNINQFPNNFRDSLDQASHVGIRDHDGQFYVAYQLSGSFFDSTSKEILPLLEKYNFVEDDMPIEPSIKQIPNYAKWYNCFFNYGGNQYLLQLRFYPLYSGGQNFVNVNVTKDSSGNAILLNSNVSVYRYFNSTVLFNNQLDHDITLKFTFLQPQGNTGSIDEMLIPSGMTFSHIFSGFSVYPDYTSYQYFITPDNLAGSVTVSHISQCMPEQVVRSLYSQIDIFPKFPTYLPTTYQHTCVNPDSVAIIESKYWNKEIPVNERSSIYHLNDKFFNDGGIEVNYSVQPSYQDKGKGIKYNKFVHAKDFCVGLSHCKTLEIDDYAAAFYDDFFTTDLVLFTDNAERYDIQGNFSEDELVKVAKSLR